MSDYDCLRGLSPCTEPCPSPGSCLPVISGDYWLKPMTVEVEFQQVDPTVLGILTGGVLGTEPEPTFAVEVYAPIRRTFWQWLTRKPKQYNHVLIPNARLEINDDTD